MFIVENYKVAVVFCIVTMLCWGSWANTQKLAEKNWRFELFYWDYVIGIVLAAILFGFTFGNFGAGGRSFIDDLLQASSSNITSAFIGGIIFNAANILIVAAISIAGMSVAFPVGIGIALLLGVLVNYIANPVGNPVVLFTGVLFVLVAILFNAFAYRKNTKDSAQLSSKGLLLSILGGVLMGFFYKFVAKSMFLDFSVPEVGKLSPYSAVFIFAIGILISNILFNSLMMRWPFTGEKVSISSYFKGRFKNHLFGILGGIIWCTGMSFSIITSDKAGPAISYGLGQGATMVAAFWGVFIWGEFKGSSKPVMRLIYVMFPAFITGLGLIILAR